MLLVGFNFNFEDLESLQVFSFLKEGNTNIPYNEILPAEHQEHNDEGCDNNEAANNQEDNHAGAAAPRPRAVDIIDCINQSLRDLDTLVLGQVLKERRERKIVDRIDM